MFMDVYNMLSSKTLSLLGLMIWKFDDATFSNSIGSKSLNLRKKVGVKSNDLFP